MLSNASERVSSYLMRGKEWSPVASDEEEAFLDGQQQPQPAERQGSSRGTLVLVWACIISLSISAVNLSLLSLRQLSASPPSKFRRPSVYIGLDRVERNASWPLPQYIANYPISISHIDKAHPDVVSKQRDVKLSADVSVVAQFRMRDFGMDNCTFGVWLSPYDMLKDAKTNRTYAVHHGSANVEVWDLDADPVDDLDWTRLSYRTRPKRRSLRAKLTVKPGAATSVPNFECPSGRVMTFEVACADANCGLEFQQDEATPRIAWMVFQYPRLSKDF
ncbi:hypothetical protein EXIGLDRAFT_699295 [Exidia glandulosa HHB12029]|uniref:Ubiquitin 3 binding protein But2 C-terminal domain-containing protein n=1 Tax=Exidia glandulosa HHB12029 TaxID=1314781 RepID=A0A166B9X2_EXIGL|nr:hypothetical protein EXIGLDRAFT_699295 [Exidia glandulosa HHB12029]